MNHNFEWVAVNDRFPPDKWTGLVITDVRPDRPVFAHVSDDWFRKEFPFAGYFLGRWRESLMIGDHMRDKAKVIAWLDTKGERLYPEINI